MRTRTPIIERKKEVSQETNSFRMASYAFWLVLVLDRDARAPFNGMMGKKEYSDDYDVYSRVGCVNFRFTILIFRCF